MPRILRRLVQAGALAAAAAGAQTPATPPYRSAFEGYRPFADQPLVPWKEANDTVGRIGGWRAYAKEAQGAAEAPADAAAPGAAPTAPTAPAAAPAPGEARPPAAAPAAPRSGRDPHAGHH